MWISDCGPDLEEPAWQEFFELWDRIAKVELDPTREDELKWGWEPDGIFSARSAYRAFFVGKVQAMITDHI